MKYFVIIEVKKIVIICALVVCCANMKAQDPQFTQFYSVPLYLSPTFAGGSQQHRFSTAFRSQWLGIPGGFNTFVISYDRYIAVTAVVLGLRLYATSRAQAAWAIQWRYCRMRTTYKSIRTGMYAPD